MCVRVCDKKITHYHKKLQHTVLHFGFQGEKKKKKKIRAQSAATYQPAVEATCPPKAVNASQREEC